MGEKSGWSLSGRDIPDPRETLSGVRDLTEDTAQRLIRTIESTQPMQHLRRSQIATGVMGLVGFALLIRGINRLAIDIPVITESYGSILLGLVLLAVAGVLVSRLTGD